MRRLLIALALLIAVPRLVSAQTHYCDAAQPTSGTAVVGQSVTLSVCSSNKDSTGNQITITGWALYDNTVRTGPLVFTQGTTSTVSGLQLYTYTFTVSAGGQHTYQVAAIDSFGEGTKSDPFVLQAGVVGSPVKPTNLTVK
jgi:hypothetical protein